MFKDANSSPPSALPPGIESGVLDAALVKAQLYDNSRLKDSLANMTPLCQPCGPPGAIRFQISQRNGEVPAPQPPQPPPPPPDQDLRRCECSPFGDRCSERAEVYRNTCSRCPMIHDLETGEPMFVYNCTCRCISCGGPLGWRIGQALGWPICQFFV